MAIAAKYKTDHLYAVDGATLNGLLSIASELSCGDKIHVDVRRDYGQWIQVRLDNLDEIGEN